MACACQNSRIMGKKKVSGAKEDKQDEMMNSMLIAVSPVVGIIAADSIKRYLVPMFMPATATAETTKTVNMVTNIGLTAAGLLLPQLMPKGDAKNAVVAFGGGVAGQVVYGALLKMITGQDAPAIAKGWNQRAYQQNRQRIINSNGVKGSYYGRPVVVSGVDNASPGVMGVDNASPGVFGKNNGVKKMAGSYPTGRRMPII